MMIFHQFVQLPEMLEWCYGIYKEEYTIILTEKTIEKCDDKQNSAYDRLFFLLINFEKNEKKSDA